jgi:hypothetical protein
MLCQVSIKPPGLALDKDKGKESASGVHVQPVTKNREGKAAVSYIVLVS